MFSNPKFSLDRWCDILGWLTLYDVGRLDSAMCNHEARQPFLEAMASLGPLCHVTLRWDPNLGDILHWIHCRKMNHRIISVTMLPNYITDITAARAIKYLAQIQEVNVVVPQQQQQQQQPSMMDQQRLQSGKFLAAMWRADMCYRRLPAHNNFCKHSCKKCSLNHCHGFKTLLDHASKCKDLQCGVPRCHGTRILLAHYSKCQDAQCNVCLETRTSIRRQRRYDDISQYLYMVKEDHLLQTLLGYVVPANDLVHATT
jgi:hypothetical protein